MSKSPTQETPEVIDQDPADNCEPAPRLPELRALNWQGHGTLVVEFYVFDHEAFTEAAEAARIAERERIAEHSQRFKDAPECKAAHKAAEGYKAAQAAEEAAEKSLKDAEVSIRQLWSALVDEEQIRAGEDAVISSRTRLELARRRFELARSKFQSAAIAGRQAARSWRITSTRISELFREADAIRAKWAAEGGPITDLIPAEAAIAAGHTWREEGWTPPLDLLPNADDVLDYDDEPLSMERVERKRGVAYWERHVAVEEVTV